ncbi:MAG: histidine kinase [Bacteroidia bacterium]|nr:histidine kinase [Bacteroidia bacterium]
MTDTFTYQKGGHHYILGLDFKPQNFRYFLWSIQVTFWLLWFLLAFNSYPAKFCKYGPLVFAFSYLPFLICEVYFNYLVLVPRFLAKRKYGIYFLSILGLIVSFQLIRFYVDHILFDNAEIFKKRLYMGVALSFFLLTITTMFKFVEAWFKMSQLQVEMQNEKLRSELQFLRSQVNPHFLFNTLNNLYSLTLVQDERAPKMVAQLSEMMRYLIYDSSTTQIKLWREIELMNSYIELQQLQYEDERNIDIYFEGIKNKHLIAPLLLISFLENCFKHGDMATNREAWISVSAIIEEENELHLSFANSYRFSSSEDATEGGIGLQNAKRQLELNYPERHKLEIIRGSDEFRVELHIELDTQESPEEEVDIRTPAFQSVNKRKDEQI